MSSVLLGQTFLAPPSAPLATSPDLAAVAAAAAGASGADLPAFARHREAENRALREQSQALRLLLEAKEEQAREANAALQARFLEGDQLSHSLLLMQEELDRCTLGYEPILFANRAPAPASSQDDLRPVAPSTPVAMHPATPTRDEVEGRERQPPSELDEDIPSSWPDDGDTGACAGTPNSRHMLSLLSVTPGPMTGSYADMPLLPPMLSPEGSAWQPMSPAPSGSPQGPLLPSPSGRLVPSPPRHAAPVTGLLSPEKAQIAPPERDAIGGVMAESEQPSSAAEVQR